MVRPEKNTPYQITVTERAVHNDSAVIELDAVDCGVYVMKYMQNIVEGVKFGKDSNNNRFRFLNISCYFFFLNNIKKREKGYLT